MKRIDLEKAFIDCFDFSEIKNYEEKIDILAKQDSITLAVKILTAIGELKDNNINWFGHEFEEELAAICFDGAPVLEENIHITKEMWQEKDKAIELLSLAEKEFGIEKH